MPEGAGRRQQQCALGHADRSGKVLSGVGHADMPRSLMQKAWQFGRGAASSVATHWVASAGWKPNMPAFAP